MLPIERLNQIQSMLHAQKVLKVEDLVNEFNVSDMTVRRDFDKLVQQGLAKRCYGGITQCNDITLDSGYRERQVVNPEAKKKIAQYCYDHFVEGNKIIYLDAGSTILSLAKLLIARHPPNLIIATNDIKIANELVDTDIQLIMIGGMVQRNLGCIHGYTAESQLCNLRMDSAFVSGLTIDDEFDLFAASEAKVYFRRKLLESCNNTYLLMDSTKTNKQSIFRIHNVSEYTMVISDKALSREEENLCKNKGITWMTV